MLQQQDLISAHNTHKYMLHSDMFMLPAYFIFVAEASPYSLQFYTHKMLLQICSLGWSEKKSFESCYSRSVRCCSRS